jgi:two-component system, sensor histidine kinase and response regulator
LENQRQAGNHPVEILVVEDSPTQAEQLKYVLEKRGFHVSSAADGREALDLLKTRTPKIVVSDVMMPGIDGYELCRRIREDLRNRELPVILVTSLSDPKDVIKGLECGANNFIVKPYDEKYLVSRIHYLLANIDLRKDVKAEMGINVFFSGENYFITAERLQILDLLLSTYENAYLQNRELIKVQQEMKELNERLEENVKELELRRQEAEEAKIEAMQANRAKSDFLANMSHELRTPLNSIIGFSEVLEDALAGKLTEKQKEYVHDIYESGEHLLSLINDILDLAKVESGKLELDVRRFFVREVLQSSMSMLREKGLRHNICLDLRLDPGAEIEISADERKFKQIMFNLLSNAIKFTPDGGNVTVAARRVKSEELAERSTKEAAAHLAPHTSQDFIEISVTDTGIGIEREDMLKLFREFSQLETAFTKKYEGTGLGLALCKKLVELHDGTIWVESEFGKGSKFTFALPLEVQRPVDHAARSAQ